MKAPPVELLIKVTNLDEVKEWAEKVVAAADELSATVGRLETLLANQPTLDIGVES